MQRLRIERLGHLGDGIAPGPVYVPGALPGEEVEGPVAGGVMAAPRIVTPVPDRVAPPCRHAKACGGCQLQHASDGFVAGWKQQVVETALAAQGLKAEVLPPVVSPAQSRRRASFSARRTKKGALAGFHQKGSDVIVAVPDCRLVRPALAAALPVVEALALLGASRKSALSVQVTESEAGLDMVATGGKPIDTALRSALAGLAETHDLARLTWDGESLTRRAPLMRMGPAMVVPPPGSFLQATAQGEAALVAAAAQAVAGARRIVDLFAGCGTFALPLSQQAELHAVEAAPEMLAALDKGWRGAQGVKRVTTEARDLFRNPLLPEDLKGFDAAVIDPPRAGAEAQIAELARAKIPVIAHISCNPVTFARDCAHLVAHGYHLHPVQVVDQFRWSTHVELAARLTYEG